MLMSAIMLFMWQSTNDNKYQAPLTKSIEATYTHSELQSYVDAAAGKARDKAPAAAAVLPAGYSFFIKKEARFTSHKISLAPGAVTTYYYDQRSKSGLITLTWAF